MKHQLQDPPCLIKVASVKNGMLTLDQAMNLQTRKKRSDRSTDEEQWYEWFRIIFPDHDPADLPLDPCK